MKSITFKHQRFKDLICIGHIKYLCLSIFNKKFKLLSNPFRNIAYRYENKPSTIIKCPFIHSFSLFSHVRLFATPWTAACKAALSFTISQSLLKLMPTESVMPSNHLLLCRPLLLLHQSFPASGSFLMSQLFESGGQSIGASVSASVFSMNIQGRFPLGLTGLISL